MAKFCTNCGNELPENAAMCVKCGKMVNENISTNKNTSNGNDKKKKGLPTWAIVLIVISCVIIIPIIIVAVLTIVTFKYVKDNVQKDDLILTLGAGTVTKIGPMLLEKN